MSNIKPEIEKEIAKQSAEALFNLVHQIKQIGVDQVLSPVKLMVNCLTNSEDVKQYLKLFEGNLWNPKDSLEDQISKMENSTMYGMASLGLTEKEIVTFYNRLDFTKLVFNLRERLDNHNFDYGTYADYVVSFKKYLSEVTLDLKG